MPVERISVMLRPDGFFTKNPALDVPPSNQAFNKSTLHQDNSTGTAGAAGACCAGGNNSKARLYRRVD